MKQAPPKWFSGAAPKNEVCQAQISMGMIKMQLTGGKLEIYLSTVCERGKGQGDETQSKLRSHLPTSLSMIEALSKQS